MSQAALLPAHLPPRMTLAAWADMPEDEPGELVDGRLVEEEVANTPHEVVVSWLGRRVGNWAERTNGLVLGSEAKFAVSPHQGRKADLSVYFTRARKLPRRGPIAAPPDVMIEVVSPTPRDGRRDRVEKLHEYAAFGVRWYWLVDPRLRTLEILRLGDDGHYALVESAAEGTVDVPGCEGLRIDIDALWREVDDVHEEPDEDSDPGL